MRRIKNSVAACAIVATAGTTFAVPTVVDIVGTTETSPNPVTLLGDGRYRINIVTASAVSGQNVVRIDCDNTDNIEILSVADLHDTSVPTVISMGVADADRPNDVQFIGAGSGEIVIDQVRILGNLGHSGVSGNAVNARQIGSLEVGGDVLNPILIKTVLSGTPRMDELVVHGDLLADINWNAAVSNDGDGEIGSILVEGTVGTASNDRVLIRAPRGIEVFHGEGNVFADVDAVIATYSPATIGVVRTGGDFVGVMEAEAFAATALDLDTGLRIKGNLISASSVVPVLKLNDPLESDHFIRIGGDFGSASVTTLIELPANGLEGQISVNAEDNAGVWHGSVKVGSTTYSEDYSALPSAIGGGAAGLAPFTMHESTASPQNNATIFITGLNILTLDCIDIPFDDDITFRLYGPVSLESGTGPHANVEVWNGGSWVDAGFDVEASIVGSTGSRGLRFERKDGMGNQIAWPQTYAQYRIVPVTDRIVCADVTGEPTADFAYSIELADGCSLQLLQRFDLDNDQDLNGGDVTEWMLNPVDLNEDENADGDDLDLLMGAINLYSSL